mmetsp:Transcript_23462/g.41597  ORF Transcript_23462/g.41597 Transcript_23462/m.41597 type:complete len:205 (-) Transcript_23462:29-643(-)
MEFRPIRFTEEAVGRALARTKRRFTWEIGIEGLYHKVMLFCSYLTSRRQVTFDGVVMFNGIKEFRKDFIFYFGAARCEFRIEDRKDFLDLFIDDQSFSAAMLARPYIPDIPDFSASFAGPRKTDEEDDWSPPKADGQKKGRSSVIVTQMMRDSFLDIEPHFHEPMSKHSRYPLSLQLSETSKRGVDVFSTQDLLDSPQQPRELI